jgi:hypothetical protein
MTRLALAALALNFVACDELFPEPKWLPLKGPKDAGQAPPELRASKPDSAGTGAPVTTAPAAPEGPAVRVSDKLEYEYVRTRGAEKASVTVALKVVALEPPLAWLEVRGAFPGKPDRPFLVAVDLGGKPPEEYIWGKVDSVKVGERTFTCNEKKTDKTDPAEPTQTECLSQEPPLQVAGGIVRASFEGQGESWKLTLKAAERGASADAAAAPEAPRVLAPDSWYSVELRPPGEAPTEMLVVRRIRSVQGRVREELSTYSQDSKASGSGGALQVDGKWFWPSAQKTREEPLVGFLAEMAASASPEQHTGATTTLHLGPSDVQVIAATSTAATERKSWFEATDPLQPSLRDVPWPARLGPLRTMFEKKSRNKWLPPRREGLVAWGTVPPTADGLARSEVRDVVEKARRSLGCDTRGKKRELKVRLLIRPDGSVAKAQVSGKKLPPKLLVCLTQGLRGLHFPSHRAQQPEWELDWAW